MVVPNIIHLIAANTTPSGCEKHTQFAIFCGTRHTQKTLAYFSLYLFFVLFVGRHNFHPPHRSRNRLGTALMFRWFQDLSAWFISYATKPVSDTEKKHRVGAKPGSCHHPLPQNIIATSSSSSTRPTVKVVFVVLSSLSSSVRDRLKWIVVLSSSTATGHRIEGRNPSSDSTNAMFWIITQSKRTKQSKAIEIIINID